LDRHRTKNDACPLLASRRGMLTQGYMGMGKQILNSSALTAHSLPNEGTRFSVGLCGDWSGGGNCVGEKAQGIF
jgi:hypothetical protein